jgi:hypothetical protein
MKYRSQVFASARVLLGWNPCSKGKDLTLTLSQRVRLSRVGVADAAVEVFEEALRRVGFAGRSDRGHFVLEQVDHGPADAPSGLPLKALTVFLRMPR